MIELYVAILFASIVFTILSFYGGRRKLIFAILATFTWLILSTDVLYIPRPYEFYNPNTGEVITGVHWVEYAGGLSTFFMGISIFMFAWSVILMADYIAGVLIGKSFLGEEEVD